MVNNRRLLPKQGNLLLISQCIHRCTLATEMPSLSTSSVEIRLTKLEGTNPLPPVVQNYN